MNAVAFVPESETPMVPCWSVQLGATHGTRLQFPVVLIDSQGRETVLGLGTLQHKEITDIILCRRLSLTMVAKRNTLTSSRVPIANCQNMRRSNLSDYAETT